MESFEDPAKTTRVLFDDPALEVTGDLVQYGSSRALPLRTWISEGHRQLWLGEPGRIYSEVAASWLGILALAGGWLWWAKRKKKRSLHSALGIWLLPGFLFLTVTGLTWSSMAGGNIANLRAELDWTQPSVNTDEHAHHGHESQGGKLSSQESIDTAAATARVAGLSGIIEIVPPAEKGAAWTVTDMREEWKLSNDGIAVDGETGEIVDRVDHADWPLAAKLSAWLIQLHMGTLFGWINQLVLGVIALGLLVVILLGYRVWWKRRRFLAAAQWRRTRPGLLAGTIVFLLAYSVMAPMFGISLVAFLVLDAVIKNVATRKSKSE